MQNQSFPQHPLAALIFEGAASTRQTASRGDHVTNMIQSIGWRQRYAHQQYHPLDISKSQENSVVLRVKQLKQGELTGLGTGAAVWPAAVVLAKYLEYSMLSQVSGVRVCELGAGTGLVGLAAAILGASEVVLTDQSQLLPLLEDNTQLCIQECGVPETSIRIAEYDWGSDVEHLGGVFQIVLVSDCVLPKLYPLEPLANALDMLLTSEDSFAVLSYEYRYFEPFDAASRFEILLNERNLVKIDVPRCQHHPKYSTDDIQIWKVKRQTGAEPAPRNIICVEEMKPVAGVASQVEDGTLTVSCTALGAEKLEIRQRLSAVQPGNPQMIGACLWPSSLELATILMNDILEKKRRGELVKILELGSGCGLLACLLGALGCDVLATDKLEVLPLLISNVDSNKGLIDAAGGKVVCTQYLWGTPFPMDEFGPFTMVLCADAIYDSTATEPLVSTLLQVAPNDQDPPVNIYMTNDSRSAFDHFQRIATQWFEITSSLSSYCTPLSNMQLINTSDGYSWEYFGSEPSFKSHNVIFKTLRSIKIEQNQQT